MKLQYPIQICIDKQFQYTPPNDITEAEFVNIHKHSTVYQQQNDLTTCEFIHFHLISP